ncbi:MAG: hypothetical protein ACLQUT_05415 [Thermoleophilia bacterium]
MQQQESIVVAINKVEHPEIALPLVVPFFGIPQVVLDFMSNSLSEAVAAAGGTMKSINVAQMSDEERQAFFQAEEANWRA